MDVLYVCYEIEGYIVDCFMEVLWCELLYIVNDGIVIIEEVDKVFIYVVGLCYV